MSLISNFQHWSRQQGAPVTIGWMISLVVVTIIAFFTGNAPFLNLSFHSSEPQVFALLTYPWAISAAIGIGIIYFVFLLAMLLFIGGSIERELGSLRFVGLTLVMILLPALLMYAGALVLHAPVALYGIALPICGLLVVWCNRNLSQSMNLMGILPISARWIGWLTVIGLFTMYGASNLLIGAISCLHLLLAHLFATNKIPGVLYSQPVYQAKQSKAARERDQAYFQEVKAREKEREERERLRKLFEGSLDDPK